MKPVNNNVRAKSGKIGHRGMRRLAKSGTDGFLKKTPCDARLVSKSTSTKPEDTIPEIPGVDQLESAPAGSVIYVANFFDDEAALLVRRAKAVLDRSQIFIAPRIGWPKSIYWKEVAK